MEEENSSLPETEPKGRERAQMSHLPDLLQASTKDVDGGAQSGRDFYTELGPASCKTGHVG